MSTSPTTTVPLTEEVAHLRSEVERLRRQIRDVQTVCRDRYMLGSHGDTVNADEVRAIINGGWRRERVTDS